MKLLRFQQLVRRATQEAARRKRNARASLTVVGTSPGHIGLEVSIEEEEVRCGG